MKMTTGIRRTVRFAWGFLHADDWPRNIALVGDRLVPKRTLVELPGADGQPRVDMTIDVINGVPRCSSLAFTHTEGGREIRQSDMRAVQVDEWIEAFVGLVSAQVVEHKDGSLHFIYDGTEEEARGGMKAAMEARKGSRRRMTDRRMTQIADAYNAHETGGLEAVQRTFGVSKATAARYVRQAREAGLIPETTK